MYVNSEMSLLFNNYGYNEITKPCINNNLIFIKKGRELEEYVLNLNSNGLIVSAKVPIVNKEVSFYTRINNKTPENVIQFLQMHLENNEKYLYQ